MLAQPNDVVMLVSERDVKTYIRKLTPGQELNTQEGVIRYDDLMGLPYGSKVFTHLGKRYYLLYPTTEELITNIKRQSQIIFPKDSGYIIMKMAVRPGVRVIETGTGSGGLTVALASAVGETGHIYSYDLRRNLQGLAKKNIDQYGLADRVTFTLRDSTEGFDETEVDGVFLDVLEPWSLFDQARTAMHGGAVLGMLVPTVNQLIQAVDVLKYHPGYGHVEVAELILRGYKPVPARVRPEDRIVGHTGYLIFARAVIAFDGDTDEPTGEAVAETSPDENEETDV